MMILQKVKDGCVECGCVNDSFCVQENAVEMDIGEGDKGGIDGNIGSLFRLFKHNGVLSRLLRKTY